MDIKQLVEEKKSWEESVKIRKASYKGAVLELKQKERELKRAKHVKYLTYKMLKVAENNVKYFDTKIKTLPRIILERYGIVLKKENSGVEYDYKYDNKLYGS